MIPNYTDVNLREIDPLCGMYSLGFIEKYYKNISIISTCDWFINNENNSTQWLDQAISDNLTKGKIVLVIFDDETLFCCQPPCIKITDILNRYKDDNMYLVTELNTETEDIMLYKDDYNIQCKILELPWLALNECMCYDYLNHPYISTNSSKYNFISFTGRMEEHKIDLINQLVDLDLYKKGLITVDRLESLSELDTTVQSHVSVNEHPPYVNNSTVNSLPLEWGCINEDGLLISSNIINYRLIQEHYSDVPLTIHSETTTGIFPSTEKSVWPVLLGKLFLIHGRPGLMSWIQRFYDFDLSEFLNLEFDDYYSFDHNRQSQQKKLKMMINDNIDLINNASEIHSCLKDKLHKARFNFGRNIYRYFISQLNTIYN